MNAINHNTNFTSFADAIAVHPLLAFSKSYQEHKKRIGKKERFGSIARRTKSLRRASNPIAPNQADILPWTLYDRNTAAAAAATATNYTFFNVPIGQGGKTKNDTNLEQVSQLSAPEWMNVQGIGIYFASTMRKVDIDTFLNTYWLEFWISQKIYAEGPLQLFPAGVGLAGSSVQNNSASLTNGVAAMGNIWDLRLPTGMPLGLDRDSNVGIVADGFMGQTILQSQTFNVKLFGSTFNLAAADGAYGGMNISCYLYGIKSRGVQ